MLLWKAAYKASACMLTIFALLASPAFASGDVAEITVIGPVESMDCGENSVTVLGTRFLTGSPNILRPHCDVYSTGSTEFVLIVATSDANGRLTISKLASMSGESYVPGVSLVMVRGSVTSADQSIGELAIAGSRFTGITDAAPSVGEFVEIVGTQPQLGGQIIANKLGTYGIVGSGVTNGIVGSGSVTNGIVGSGVTTRGIVGSGVATHGIVGSGAALNGIVGSGSQTSGIVGSGVTTRGIVGSGVATHGIVGSGAALNGIVGSGLQTSGIVGSGAATSGIVGSGVVASGIVGSGVETSGIVGSGIETRGIVGSGVATRGIVGSGAATNGIVGSGF